MASGKSAPEEKRVVYNTIMKKHKTTSHARQSEWKFFFTEKLVISHSFHSMKVLKVRLWKAQWAIAASEPLDNMKWKALENVYRSSLWLEESLA